LEVSEQETTMYELIHGNCIEVLRSMPDKSVDCIVTDPPYGVGLDYLAIAKRRIAQVTPDFQLTLELTAKDITCSTSRT
jgi:DNA modification methylase